MTRLAKTFATLKAQHKKALVAYLTAGDPDLATSVAAALAAVQAGADVLEVGVPFSDPVADGPVIQRAMLRALAAGGGFEPALEVVRAVRAKSDVPIVVFGYVNPLLWRGLDASFAAMQSAGADGVLVVDVPIEESAPFVFEARKHKLDWVTLVAPTSGVERARAAARDASGFVYMVSMTGVTGGALAETSRLPPLIAAVQEANAVPVCIGFGIRDQASARAAAKLGDGIVVGSALVQALEQGAEQHEGPARVTALVTELRRGLQGG